MKNFILGMLFSLLYFIPAAKAIEAQLSMNTIRDFYASTAMGGLVARGYLSYYPADKAKIEEVAKEAFRIADVMMKMRSK